MSGGCRSKRVSFVMGKWRVTYDVGIVGEDLVVEWIWLREYLDSVECESVCEQGRGKRDLRVVDDK
jgi:hypothetical protein